MLSGLTFPYRVVHARGCGAYGYFENLRDMTDVSSADFLGRVGKRTPLFARFSTTAGEKGSAETVRDVRGMAFKLYTNEGNLDWVFLSQVSDYSLQLGNLWLHIHRR